jgi:NaMN:DMB phosphoribosyltransferase
VTDARPFPHVPALDTEAEAAARERRGTLTKPLGATLHHLRLEPIVDLGMRLGEGTGAAVALSILRAAVATLASMATFDEAHVADSTL